MRSRRIRTTTLLLAAAVGLVATACKKADTVSDSTATSGTPAMVGDSTATSGTPAMKMDSVAMAKDSAMKVDSAMKKP